MAKFNLDDYETVEDRLRKFWEDHPAGRVESDLSCLQRHPIHCQGQCLF